MQTAKVFVSGGSQAVRLPKSCRFESGEVGVSRFGKIVVLYPVDDADALFYSSLGNFSDDFFSSVESVRTGEFPSAPRVEL